eukprot:EG_transcript_35321
MSKRAAAHLGGQIHLPHHQYTSIRETEKRANGKVISLVHVPKCLADEGESSVIWCLSRLCSSQGVRKLLAIKPTSFFAQWQPILPSMPALRCPDWGHQSLA